MTPLPAFRAIGAIYEKTKNHPQTAAQAGSKNNRQCIRSELESNNTIQLDTQDHDFLYQLGCIILNVLTLGCFSSALRISDAQNVFKSYADNIDEIRLRINGSFMFNSPACIAKLKNDVVIKIDERDDSETNSTGVTRSFKTVVISTLHIKKEGEVFPHTEMLGNWEYVATESVALRGMSKIDLLGIIESDILSKAYDQGNLVSYNTKLVDEVSKGQW